MADQQTRRALKIWSAALAASIAAGVVAGLDISEGRVLGALRGALTALFIAGPIITFEVFYANDAPGRWMRERPVSVFFAVKVAFYALAVVVGEFLTRAILHGTPAVGPIAFDAVLARTFGISLIIIIPLNFVMVMNRMLGRQVLASYVTGRYHRPRAEERIFLFLDLVGSTALAERLGDVRFHEYLNRFVFDVTGPILDSGGEIYRYVGDEVIATWKLADRARNAGAIECYLEICKRIAAAADGYDRDYGAHPAFRAALHAGTVVVGEMGDAKRELTFIGDVVNTTARLEGLCREKKRDNLISGTLLDAVDLPADVAAEPVGSVEIRGKKEPVDLYSLQTSAA